MILTQVLLFASISIIKWAMLKWTPLPAERRSDRPRSLLRTLAPLQLLGRARRLCRRRLMRPCLTLQARRWRRSHLRASRACARGQPHSSLSANGPNRPCSTTPGCPSPCRYEFFCDTFPSTLVMVNSGYEFNNRNSLKKYIYVCMDMYIYMYFFIYIYVYM